MKIYSSNLALAIFSLITFAGCGYEQPALDQPYGIIEPVGNLKILEIDGERIMSLSGDYTIRAVPGPHTLVLNYTNNTKTRAEGSDSYLGKLKLEVEEGMRYYLETKYNYGKENIFFGVNINAVKSWMPALKNREPIKEYRKQKIENKNQ